MRGPLFVLVAACLGPGGGLTACRDLSNFTTFGDRFEGVVVSADFARVGVDPGTTACLTIDAEHLQDAPGSMSTSDGRFHAVPLRPIPQVWHDPLSTLSFGEGRLKNLLYVVTASIPFEDGKGDDALAVVSLMQSGDVELRIVRSAPALPADGSAPPVGSSVFAIFDLSRRHGPCS